MLSPPPSAGETTKFIPLDFCNCYRFVIKFTNKNEMAIG